MVQKPLGQAGQVGGSMCSVSWQTLLSAPSTAPSLCHLKLAQCMQVLAASLVDMLQAGIHQQQPGTPGKPAATMGLVQPSPAPLGAGAATQASTKAPNAAGPGTSIPQPAEPASEQAAESALERSCIFEVEVVLTSTGTKLMPSISQFLVGYPFGRLSSAQTACPHLVTCYVCKHMHGSPPSGNGFVHQAYTLLALKGLPVGVTGSRGMCV